jgi:hypothetical protein
MRSRFTLLRRSDARANEFVHGRARSGRERTPGHLAEARYFRGDELHPPCDGIVHFRPVMPTKRMEGALPLVRGLRCVLVGPEIVDSDADRFAFFRFAATCLSLVALRAGCLVPSWCDPVSWSCSRVLHSFSNPF